VVYNNWDGGVV